MKKLYALFLSLIASVSLVGFQQVDAKAIDHIADVKAAAPETYYSSADTSTGEKLMSSLHTIISNGHKSRGYDALFEAYKTTDVYPGTTKVWDMYSNCNYDVVKDHGGQYSKEGDCYNREHTVPQSWFSKQNPMVCDANHIYPTDGKVNGMRSNYLHGEVKDGTVTYTSSNGCKLGSSSSSLYSGKVFEVPDEYKGDFARTYFYMATRYSNLVGNWGGEANKVFKGSFPYLTAYSIDMYTKWDALDPVSQKEIDRNNAVYEFQGNRNPFIDHPEYVSIIWPSDYNQNVTVDSEKVNRVIELISKLPEAANITLDNKEQVETVSSAYNLLNYKEKKDVTNYSKLKSALDKLASLQSSTGGSTDNPVSPIVSGDGVTITFSGVTTESYVADKSFNIGNYGFKANILYAETDGDNGTFVRVGSKGNKLPDIPAKFGISGKGGSLEMTTDVENATGVTFNVGAQMTGSTVSNWTIFASTNAGSTWTSIGSGTSINGSISANMTAAATARFALVITGETNDNKGPRLDLTSMVISLSNSSTPTTGGTDTPDPTQGGTDDPTPVATTQVNLSDVTTNSYLNVNYKIKDNEVLEASAKTVILSHVDLEYNLTDVKYYVLYLEKTNDYVFKNNYTSGNLESFKTVANATAVEATLSASEDELLVKAELSLDVAKTYLVVVVCEQDGKLVFANQAQISNKEMIKYYFDNNLITDNTQKAVLEFLAK